MNKHKSNKIKENSNTVRHLIMGQINHHSKSCCDQRSPARRTNTQSAIHVVRYIYMYVRMHVYIYTHAYLHTRTCANTYKQPKTRMRIGTLPQTHNRTHIYIHKHLYTRLGILWHFMIYVRSRARMHLPLDSLTRAIYRYAYIWTYLLMRVCTHKYMTIYEKDRRG